MVKGISFVLEALETFISIVLRFGVFPVLFACIIRLSVTVLKRMLYYHKIHDYEAKASFRKSRDHPCTTGNVDQN